MIDRRLLQRALRSLAAGIVTATFLAGCASSSGQTALFKLSDSVGVNTGDSTPSNDVPRDAPILVVKPVALAPYLDQGGIVYQTAPHRVVVAANNRWASPLADELTDNLAETLDARLSNVDVQRAAPGGDNGHRVVTLTTHVSQFIGHFEGDARIGGRWRLTTAKGEKLAAEKFSRQVALKKSGYPALVASLSTGWYDVSRAIAAQTAKALAKRDSK